MNEKEKLIYSTKDEKNSEEWIKVVDRLPYHMQEVRVYISHPTFLPFERAETAVYLAFTESFYDAEEQTSLNYVSMWRPLHPIILNHADVKVGGLNE